LDATPVADLDTTPTPVADLDTTPLGFADLDTTDIGFPSFDSLLLDGSGNPFAVTFPDALDMDRLDVLLENLKVVV